MPKIKDKYEKCNTIFKWRSNLFKDDVEDECKNTVDELIDGIETNENTTDSGLYKKCLEVNEKIEINGEEYKVRITFYSERMKRFNKKEKVMYTVPVFLDIISVKGKEDYFLKFDGQKIINQECPICYIDYTCTAIVELKLGRAYFKTFCNKKNCWVEEEKLRENFLKKKK
jgi:hypothetical protein